jgi:hypothetical protein
VKVVYFATGSLEEVIADFSRLRSSINGAAFRVVAPPEGAQQLAKATSLEPHELILYRPMHAPWLWLRLITFLGLSRRAEVVCLTSPQRFRFLKLLALTLRGRVVFSPVSGRRAPLGFLDLARIWLRQARDGRERCRRHLPIGVIGSASGYYLERIVPAVRARYPNARLHGLLLPSATMRTQGLFDSVRTIDTSFFGVLGEFRRLRHDGAQYQRWIIPCTNEPYRYLKVLSFLWPLRRRQIYNELADGFAVRSVRTLIRHFQWRLRDQLGFQILSGAAGGSAPARMLHLTLYAARLVSSVPLLSWALLRSLRAPSAPASGTPQRKRLSEEPALVTKSETVRIKLARTISSGHPPAEPGGSVPA